MEGGSVFFFSIDVRVKKHGLSRVQKKDPGPRRQRHLVKSSLGGRQKMKTRREQFGAKSTKPEEQERGRKRRKRRVKSGGGRMGEEEKRREEGEGGGRKKNEVRPVSVSQTGTGPVGTISKILNRSFLPLIKGFSWPFYCTLYYSY